MTGNDDGGFTPHPGDPWHPGWRSDDEASEDPASEQSDVAGDDEPVEPKRRRLFGRRKSDDDPGEEPAVERPDDAAEEADEPVSETIEPVGDDPFDAVLRAEGRAVRGRSSAPDRAPEPAWTSDDEIPEELRLPDDQPSSIGEPTGIDPGQESIGVEPEGEPDGGTPSPEASFEPIDSSRSDTESGDGAPVEAAGEVSEVAGKYGVAGPEAFDALADTAEEELDDWEAFMGGSAEASQPVTEPLLEVPAEASGDPEVFDEWDDSEPRRKRRWFRRSADDAVDEPIESSEIEDWATEAGPEPSPAPAPTVGGEAGDDWLAETGPDEDADDDALFMPPIGEPHAEEIAAAGEPLGDVFDEDDFDEDVFDEDDPEAAVAAALEALGIPYDDGGQAMGESEPEAEPLPTDATSDVPVPESGDEPWSVADQPIDRGVTSPDDEVEPSDTVWAPPVDTTDDVSDTAAVEEPAPAPLAGEVEDAVVEEPVDWDGDPSRVPDSWFAEVDEDTVVPPTVAETPETEWPSAEGPWEGRAAWEAEPSTEVFDVEEASALADQASAGVDPADAAARYRDQQPVVPEGYQDWGEAVADAIPESGEETAEYHLQHIPPPADALPEGFEPFPGAGPAAAYGEGFDDREDGRMGDEIDGPPDHPTPHESDDDDAFDERIYTAGGTVEHRGLADAIAAAGEDDDTEWQAMSAAMAGVETGVLGFEDVADLASGDEYVAPVRSNLGIRVLTGLILAGLLFGSLLVAGWAFALFVTAIVTLGLGEFYMTLRRRGYSPLSLFGLVGAVGTLLATWFHGPIAIPSGILLTTVVVFFFYAFAPTRRDALSNGGLTVLGMAWATGALAFAIAIARAEEFQILVLAVVAATAAMDIGAFSFGRRWGRRPLAQILSPNKTLEGLLGGTLLAVLVASGFGFFELGPFDLAGGLALGAVVAVAAPLGDLAESMVKRSMAVKDMGSTLPGHGGVLDRIDALVFVVPAAWVLFETIGYLG